MKKPVSRNASNTGSGRQAQSHDQRMAEADRRLNAIWKEKGLVDENNTAMGSTRYDPGVRPKTLPEGVDEESLRKRNVKFEGIEENRETPLYSFTWNTPGGESTLTIDITEKDIIPILDKKIEENKAIRAASLNEKMNEFWAQKGLVDKRYEPLGRTRHSNSLEERKIRST